MTAVTLPNSGLTAGHITGESGWGPTMNRNLRVLDALTQTRVVDKDLTAPPGSPASGSLYIVGPSPTGAWSSYAGYLALYQAGDDSPSAWTFVNPKNGWRVFVIDESKYYRYNGSAWAEDASAGEANTLSSLGGTSLVGEKSGVDLRVKGLTAQQGVVLTPSLTDVAIRTVYISATDPGAVGPGVFWLVP